MNFPLFIFPATSITQFLADFFTILKREKRTSFQPRNHIRRIGANVHTTPPHCFSQKAQVRQLNNLRNPEQIQKEIETSIEQSKAQQESDNQNNNKPSENPVDPMSGTCPSLQSGDATNANSNSKNKDEDERTRVEPPFKALMSFNCTATMLSYYGDTDQVYRLMN